MDKDFQRKGSKSNSHVGKDFEDRVKEFFEKRGLILTKGVSVPIGIRETKKHSFDLGCDKEKVLVECKSHKWTEGDNVPSAKVTTWNQAMFFFYVTPGFYRKIFVALKDRNRKGETLAEYYIRTNRHLVPTDVEIWEYDEYKSSAIRIY